MKFLYYFLFIYSLIIAPLQAKNIVVIGDSLSAGYGIDPQLGWVNLLGSKLAKEDHYKIINLSTSGDTTSNGLAKFDNALTQYKPNILIIELGANDGLRGLSLNQMKNNLETMLKKSNKAGIKVMLLGIDLPPNYGPKYANQFKQVFQDLAKTYKVALVPMFLDGVAGNTLYIQNDGLHPNENAQPLILDNVWPTLIPLL
ncbi:arylesterase [Legionella quateirensis]|uniref:Esterase TesA n=1 Tax=Legionella quateirensis TaxID=45072 RepID=A0A378KTY7_9GAMM|nr:arylesterase [Legionella quateirensis]KTD54767.1 Esterase TesA precursor [Legionella quateirensis]STY16947.1 Esterase TesA precursor [Legionella quateirensis]